jgi:hypothetical protein
VHAAGVEAPKRGAVRAFHSTKYETKKLRDIRKLKYFPLGKFCFRNVIKFGQANLYAGKIENGSEL